jgi:hypothetical protein
MLSPLHPQLNDTILEDEEEIMMILQHMKDTQISSSVTPYL